MSFVFPFHGSAFAVIVPAVELTEAGLLGIAQGFGAIRIGAGLVAEVFRQGLAPQEPIG